MQVYIALEMDFLRQPFSRRYHHAAAAGFVTGGDGLGDGVGNVIAAGHAEVGGHELAFRKNGDFNGGHRKGCVHLDGFVADRIWSIRRADCLRGRHKGQNAKKPF
jgi:hypothetical protein